MSLLAPSIGQRFNFEVLLHTPSSEIRIISINQAWLKIQFKNSKFKKFPPNSKVTRGVRQDGAGIPVRSDLSTSDDEDQLDQVIWRRRSGDMFEGVDDEDVVSDDLLEDMHTWVILNSKHQIMPEDEV